MSLGSAPIRSLAVLATCVLLMVDCSRVFADATAPVPRRVYPHLMDPREHPDYGRRAVKPPSWETFKNQPQFTCLRGFNVDNDRITGYSEELEKFTRTFELGNVIWPSYPILFATNLVDLATEIKRRDLFLFDVWGYVPGSGPGGYWQQFKPPREAFKVLESTLGERWLGTDIGEQDGRYIGGYANQLTPASAEPFEQYLNFHRHFERMGDELGNKHATLVSLNFGHYLIKEGTYTLIGAETAQALPNNQVYYAFIRGAGKQYGVPWFGNASIFNRWGFKTYGSSGKSDGYEHGPLKGTSLSLLKRLLYTHILYNSVAVGFENGWFDGDKLSPIGRIQQSAQRWVKENGSPGVMHAPVGLLLDFYSGWSFPRHLYSENIYRVWGNLPYGQGDYLTDSILDLLYPGYQDSSFFHDETGFIAPTPFGDIADVLLSDAPEWLLRRYPLLIVAGELRGGAELGHKLEDYTASGGHLIITAGNLAKFPGGIAGVEKGGGDAAVNVGKGRVTVLPGPFGLEPAASAPLRSEVDMPLAKPFRLVDEARRTIAGALHEQMLFDVGNSDLSFVTTRKAAGHYLVGIGNNSWTQKSFLISSRCGKIRSIRELAIDPADKTAPGYVPETVTAAGCGESTAGTIAGGDFRVFAVEVDESGVLEIPHVPPPSAPRGRWLPLRQPTSIQREILARPTFFEHFDGVLVDGDYFRARESRALQEESTWLSRQHVRVAVDLSSSIDLYPGLRLINNLESDYKASMAFIEDVIEKMALLGAHDMLLSLHRFPENNFSGEQTIAAFGETLRALSEFASKRGVTLYLRTTFGKPPWSLLEAGKWLEQWKLENVRLAVATALLPEREPSKEEMELLRKRAGLWLVAGVRRDVAGKIWDAHALYHASPRTAETRVWLSKFSDTPIALDANFANKDEEYLDCVALEQISRGKSP